MWARIGIKGCRRRRPINQIKGHRPVNQTLTLGHVHVEGAHLHNNPKHVHENNPNFLLGHNPNLILSRKKKKKRRLTQPGLEPGMF